MLPRVQLAAVVFDFDGVILDSETCEFWLSRADGYHVRGGAEEQTPF
jgi:beta-phosphoglucomutase-like phosphatase (HAD superfamily)